MNLQVVINKGIARNVLVLFCAVNLILSSTFVTFAAGESPAAVLNDKQLVTADKLSNDAVQKEAAKLLLFASLISVQSGNMVAISPQVRNKYGRLVKEALAGIPITIGGVTTLAFTQSSLDGSLLEIFNNIAKQIGDSLNSSFKSIFESKSVQSASEKSTKAWDLVWGIIQPLVGRISTKKIGLSFGSLAAGASLTSSIYLTYNTPESALSSETAQRYLGYSKELDQKIDATVRSVSEVFILTADQSAELKSLIKEELLKQATAKSFASNESYHVDVVRLMGENNLISKDLYQATRALAQIFEAVQQSGRVNMEQSAELRQNVEVVALLAAVIEEQLQQNGIKGAEAEQAKVLLYDAEKTLQLVKTNFQ